MSLPKMQIRVESPFAGLQGAGDLLDLSYFDAMACVGELSMHCGGLKNTSDLLYMAGVDGKSSILEIGCGTGATTRALLRAGLNVVVVEPSRRMVSAMVRNCFVQAGRVPEHHLASAEDLAPIGNACFDVLLLECVFGFIGGKSAAVSEFARVLKRGGVIAVTDFHYLGTPPDGLKRRLSEQFGIGELLTRDDWQSRFSAFDLAAWESIPLAPSTFSPDLLERQLLRSNLIEHFPGGREGVRLLSERLTQWELTFAENRRYLAGHNAIWRKTAASSSG